MMDNILADGKLKTSSNDAMSNSLTDASTETFWESRDEGRSKTRSITVTFDNPAKVFAGCIHIDNQKDAGVSITNYFSTPFFSYCCPSLHYSKKLTKLRYLLEQMKTV